MWLHFAIVFIFHTSAVKCLCWKKIWESKNHIQNPESMQHKHIIKKNHSNLARKFIYRSFHGISYMQPRYGTASSFQVWLNSDSEQNSSVENIHVLRTIKMLYRVHCAYKTRISNRINVVYSKQQLFMTIFFSWWKFAFQFLAPQPHACCLSYMCGKLTTNIDWRRRKQKPLQPANFSNRKTATATNSLLSNPIDMSGVQHYEFYFSTCFELQINNVLPRANIQWRP